MLDEFVRDVLKVLENLHGAVKDVALVVCNPLVLAEFDHSVVDGREIVPGHLGEEMVLHLKRADAVNRGEQPARG